MNGQGQGQAPTGWERTIILALGGAIGVVATAELIHLWKAK